MGTRQPGRLRPSQRQRFSRRLLLAAGLSAFAFALGTVIYLQFHNPEQIKANKAPDLTSGTLPVAFDIEEAVTLPADTNQRNGIPVKNPRPLSETPVYPQ